MNPSVKIATSWAIRSSRTRRRLSRLPFPPDRIWPARSSASSRGSPKTGARNPTWTRGSGTLSKTISRRSPPSVGGTRQVAERRDVRVRRDRPEVALGGGQDIGGLDVADDRQDRVVRRVVGPEERADVLDRGRVEVVHRSDRRVVVRVLRREEVALELLLERAVRPVVVRPALLVLDDLALVVEVLLAERVEEGRHPVGLEPQGQLELVRRQRLEVVRPVEPGRAVHRPAGGLDERDVLGLGDVPRALEHDVLEEVGEAGLAGDLVLGPDVVPEVDRDDRGEVVLGHDDAQAVVEALVAERRPRGRRWARVTSRVRGGAGRDGSLATIVPPSDRKEDEDRGDGQGDDAAIGDEPPGGRPVAREVGADRRPIRWRPSR